MTSGYRRSGIRLGASDPILLREEKGKKYYFQGEIDREIARIGPSLLIISDRIMLLAAMMFLRYLIDIGHLLSSLIICYSSMTMAISTKLERLQVAFLL